MERDLQAPGLPYPGVNVPISIGTSEEHQNLDIVTT